MDGVVAKLFGALCKLKLAGGGAALGFAAELEVLLGGGSYDLAQKLGKFCRVLGFLICRLEVKRADLRVALADSLAAHCDIHTYLGALAFKVRLESGVHLVVYLALGADADNVLAGVIEGIILHLFELGAGNAALRALLGRGITFVNITANGTYKLFHDFFSLCF